MDENGVEYAETDDRTQPSEKLGIDFRIPDVPNPAGGMCSRVTFEVQDKVDLADITLVSGNEPGGGSGSGHYLQFKGALPIIDYDGGQVTIEDSNGEPQTTTAKFVGERKTYVTGSGDFYSYIEISESITTPSPVFKVLIRPILMTTGFDTQIKTKLYNFNPYPLYFVVKMSDKSNIHNISIKETSGENTKTSSPKLFVSNVLNNTQTLTWSGSGQVTLANGNTGNDAAAPTNFQSFDRLSGSEVDTQNTQNIRPGTLRDTLYVGKENELRTEEVDMSKVFGVDRRVIAPDRNNIEATFITAKKIDSGATGEIQLTLNYEEQ